MTINHWVAIGLTLVLILGYCFIRIFSGMFAEAESKLRVKEEIKKLSKVRTYIFDKNHDTLYPELNLWFDPVRYKSENSHLTDDEIKLIGEALFKKFCDYDDFIFIELDHWMVARLPYGATITFGKGSLDCYDRPYVFETPIRDNDKVTILDDAPLSSTSKILRTVRKL